MSVFWAAVLATALVAIFYLFAAVAISALWGHKLPANPLKITAESSGRASLSKSQVFFFTLIIAWLALYWVLREGELIPFDNSILILLGVAAGGAGLGRVAGAARFRVTGANCAWAKNKGWIKQDFTKTSFDHTPKLSDLIISDQGFEVSRFQAVVFSVIVGIALFYQGVSVSGAQDFEKLVIDDAYLALIGLSQTVYVGGKLVGENKIAELNALLNKVRKLELAFTVAVSESSTWIGENEINKITRTLRLARERCAPKEFLEYMSAVLEVASIVESLTGNKISKAKMEPRLPPRQ